MTTSQNIKSFLHDLRAIMEKHNVEGIGVGMSGDSDLAGVYDVHVYMYKNDKTLFQSEEDSWGISVNDINKILGDYKTYA